jgi:hypothetical protein
VATKDDLAEPQKEKKNRKRYTTSRSEMLTEETKEKVIQGGGGCSGGLGKRFSTNAKLKRKIGIPFSSTRPPMYDISPIPLC